MARKGDCSLEHLDDVILFQPDYLGGFKVVVPALGFSAESSDWLVKTKNSLDQSELARVL